MRMFISEAVTLPQYARCDEGCVITLALLRLNSRGNEPGICRVNVRLTVLLTYIGVVCHDLAGPDAKGRRGSV
jgi:hypothetical protein